MSHLKKASLAVIFFFILSFWLVTKVSAEPYGWSPDVDNSWEGPPTCTDSPPDKAPILLQPNHPALPKANETGAIRLQWHKVPGATGYNVYFGLSSRNYIFAAPDVGDTDNFTVTHLANRLYYFAVQAQKGCAAGDLSNEWSARPGGSYYQLAAVPGFVPVTQTTQFEDSEDSYVAPSVPSPTPKSKAAVEGITAQPRQDDTTYEPPSDTQQMPPRVPTPTPEPKGFLGRLLDFIFGLFGR